MSDTKTDIIVSGKNPTIEYGMELLKCPPNSPNAIMAKQVGLQLTLLGLAEIQAKRISNLAVATYELEQRLYSPEHLQTVDTKKLLSTYQSVNQALNEAIQYVQTAQGLEWNAVIEKLNKIVESDGSQAPEINPADEEAHRRVSSAAKELLALASDHAPE